MEVIASASPILSADNVTNALQEHTDSLPTAVNHVIVTVLDRKTMNVTW
jgi:hypothetical protein